jgi:hypothetical protein
MEDEIYQLFDGWLQKTKRVLLDQQKKRKVGITQELEKSLEVSLRTMGEGYL